MPTRAEIEGSLVQCEKILHVPCRPVLERLNKNKGSTKLKPNRKLFSVRSAQTVKDVLMERFNGRVVDDKTYIMERVIQLAAELPLKSKAGLGLTNSFLTKLWGDLNHPPLSSLANELRYRAADGSNNNPFLPRLGAAGSPYARTVSPQSMQPATLPDAGLIFDSVMKRKSFRPHPNKISSVLFYFATIITHDLFKTSARAPQNSGTSSYLDLGPLYGSSEEEQSQIRTFRDGKIKPDSFCESRILSMPPGAGIILIMFNRFHNEAVEQLATINEQHRFTKPSNPGDKDALSRYDNDLFQTGRLITCGLYVNIILKAGKESFSNDVACELTGD